MKIKLYKKIRNRIKVLNKDKLKLLYSHFKESKFIQNNINDKDFYKLYMRDDLFNKKFFNNLALFINNIDIKKIEKTDLITIYKIFFEIFWIYYKFLKANKILIKPNKKIYISNRTEFIISSVRILEFIIFIGYSTNKEMKEIFLQNFSSKLEYFFYLQKLDYKIKNNYFAICKNEKTKQNRIIVGFNKKHCKEANQDEELRREIFKNSFKSTIKTQSFENDNLNEFENYFHLQNQTIINFYDFKEAQIKSKEDGSKTRTVNKIKFTIIKKEITDDISFNSIKLQDSEMEVKKEIKLKSRNKLISPILDKRVAKLTNSNLLEQGKEVNIESKYKRYLIAKAIGGSITKNNLSISKYQILEIEQLKDFFAFLYKEDKFKTDLILLQILFNTNIKKFIKGFLNKNIKFKSPNQISIRYIDVFSHVENKEFFKDISSKKSFYIYLNEVISVILDNFQIEIINKLKEKQGLEDFNLEDELDNIEKELNEFLKQVKNKFNKTIILNLRTLPVLSLFYFKKTKQNSSISLLFTKDIDKNDEAKLCYCATSKRLVEFENWLVELTNILSISKYRFNEDVNNKIINQFKEEPKIGSYKVLRQGEFKTFLMNLEKLYFEDCLTNTEKINIQMLYLRYTLGLLLATRDFEGSCDLSNYSEKFRVLLLQEKAKNFNMSKRIIPLTKRAIKYIKNFKQLIIDIEKIEKSKLNSPFFIINNKTKVIVNSSIKLFVESLEKYDIDYLRDIEQFIKNCKLNFGRHIITSYFSNLELKEEYLDAFLNHSKMGNEDQGIYSYFNNTEYIDTIINNLELLEQDYLRKYDRIFKESI